MVTFVACMRQMGRHTTRPYAPFVKIVQIETLISVGTFPQSDDWKRIERDLQAGVAAVHWPPDSGRFIIRPVAKGNGVKPIKDAMILSLKNAGWQSEKPLDLATAKKPGKLDAIIHTLHGPFAFEWETGNISSSHRALNKMALGILKGKLVGGALVVPTRKLYKYLTDRVGNYAEIEPYLDLWKAIPCTNGVLQIIVVEHDATSTSVPLISKGTDGRALV